MQWQTGWLDAYWMLVGIAVEFDFERFLALWLLGMLLGALTLRARTLWPAVGLHGGLVFGMLMYHDLARSLGPPSSFWGTTALIDGWATPADAGALFAWRHSYKATQDCESFGYSRAPGNARKG